MVRRTGLDEGNLLPHRGMRTRPVPGHIRLEIRGGAKLDCHLQVLGTGGGNREGRESTLRREGYDVNIEGRRICQGVPQNTGGGGLCIGGDIFFNGEVY